MKVFTVRNKIQQICKRWDKQYPRNSQTNPKHLEIGNVLRSLNLETTTPKDITTIIGNDSWVRLEICDECGEESSILVQIGEKLDWESSTAIICAGCLGKAMDAIDLNIALGRLK